MDQSLNYQTPMCLDNILKLTKGDEERLLKKVFTKLQKSGRYKASRKKSIICSKNTTWLGHKMNERGLKTNKKNKNHLTIETTDIK